MRLYDLEEINKLRPFELHFGSFRTHAYNSLVI